MTDAPGSVKTSFSVSSTPSSACAVTPDIILPPTDSTSLRQLDGSTSGQFVLDQNYPNPYTGETTIPFTLANPADVRLDIADMAGRKVAGVVRKNRNPGAQSIKLNLSGLGLPPGDYIYELQVTTRHGVFCQSKLMTTK